MKNIFTLFLIVSGFFASNTLLALPTNEAVKAKTNVNSELTKDSNFSNVEDFLNLTPKMIEEATGQKLNFIQKAKLKTAQKIMSKVSGKGGSKSQLVALILVLLVGVIGIHRFYLGYPLIGIIQLLTLGGLGIWTLIDLILIIIGKLGPKNGSYDDTF